MRTQKKHKKNLLGYIIYQKMRLILSFCGGACPKFGMIDPKEVHERQNTKIKIIK